MIPQTAQTTSTHPSVESVSYIGTHEPFSYIERTTQPFGLDQPDRLHHLYCIGKTGMGKSTLLENLAIQDIRAGRGMAFIDVHGSSAERLLDFIPPWRRNHVIYFNPQDQGWPIGLNVLAHVPATKRELVANQVLSIFTHIWKLEEDRNPRLLSLLHNCIATLLEQRGTTLFSIYRLLIDENYRQAITKKVQDKYLRQYWQQEFASLSNARRTEIISSTLYRVGRFLASPTIRNCIAQSSPKLNFPYLMDRRRIIIANLSKGAIGETASNLLGSILITQLYLAAMSRMETDDYQHPPMYLYVDEFQNFSTDVFKDILSEARKYRLALTLAHQHMAQLPDDLREAVIGNVGSMISFRTGRNDAEVLAREYSEDLCDINPSLFTALAAYQIRARLLNEGAPVQPISGWANPPEDDPSYLGSDIEAQSRLGFATPRGKVEQKLELWLNRNYGY